MRLKRSDVASGMHTPTGENMWASPVDDKSLFENEFKKEIKISIKKVKDSAKKSDKKSIKYNGINIVVADGSDVKLEGTITKVEADKLLKALTDFLEGDKLKKKALGLTSIPSEQQRDYEFNQPFHTKDSDNVGVIDTDSVTDLPAINNAKDSNKRPTMKDVLNQLFDQFEERQKADNQKVAMQAAVRDNEKIGDVVASLDEVLLRRGYNYSNALKSVAYTDYELGLKANLPSENTVKSTVSQESQALRLLLSELRTKVEDLSVVLHNYPQFNANLDVLKYETEYLKLFKAIQSIINGSKKLDSKLHNDGVQHLSTEILQLISKIGQENKEFSAQQYSNEVGKGSQDSQVSKPRLSGWSKFTSTSADHKKFSEMWQSSPPAGYTSDYESFKKWYLIKSKELGRHFDASEALTMLAKSSLGDPQKEKLMGLSGAPNQEPRDKSEKPITQPQTPAQMQNQIPAQTQAPVQQIEEGSVRAKVEKFLSEIMSNSKKLRGALGTRNMAAKSRIRNLGGVELATDAILAATGGWENLAGKASDVRQDSKGRQALSEFETAVWNLLREARRVQRRSSNQPSGVGQAVQDRAVARAHRVDFLKKIAG